MGPGVRLAAVGRRWVLPVMRRSLVLIAVVFLAAGLCLPLAASLARRSARGPAPADARAQCRFVELAALPACGLVQIVPEAETAALLHLFVGDLDGRCEDLAARARGELHGPLSLWRDGASLDLFAAGRHVVHADLRSERAGLLCAWPKSAPEGAGWRIERRDAAALVEGSATSAAVVEPQRAIIELRPGPSGVPLRHLLVGDVQRGRYAHVLLGERTHRFGGENSGAATSPAPPAAAAITISRSADRVRLYADGTLIAAIRAPDEALELLCASDGQAPEDRWSIHVQDAGGLRFADDFMRNRIGKEDGWTLSGGRWWIDQEAEVGAAPNAFMLQVKPEAGPSRATTGFPFWHNYRLSASVSLPERAGFPVEKNPIEAGLGLLFGLDEAGEGWRVVLRGDPDGDTLSLERTDSDVPLARAELAPRLGRWTALSVDVAEDAPLRVAVDGVVLLEHDFAAEPRAPFGRVGLWAEGAGGRFDDVSVVGLDELPAPDAMQPVVQFSKTFHTKPRFLNDDRDDLLHRWASDSDAWQYRRMLLESADSEAPVEARGWVNSTPLYGDFEASIGPLEAARLVALHDATGALLLSERIEPSGGPLVLRRLGGRVSLGEAGIGMVPPALGVHLGYYALQGVPFTKEFPALCSRSVVQDFFETAPVQWMPASGEWELTVRWQCNPKWNFFGGFGPDLVALFSKKRFEGNQTHEFYFGMKDLFGGEFERRRYARHDVNFSFCTNGRDLNSGYTLLFSGRDGKGSYLLRGDRIVATNEAVRLPAFAGSENDLHTKWWRMRVEKTGPRIRVLWDETVVFDWSDPEGGAPDGGHVALWTWRNGVVYARVKSSAEAVADASARYLAPLGKARLDGWEAMDPSRVRLTPTPEGRVRVHQRFGGGDFAVRRALDAPVDLAATPVLRLPFRADAGARVNLHLIIGGRAMVLGLTAPMEETMGLLGDLSRSRSGWRAYVEPPLRPPAVQEGRVWDPARELVEVDLLQEARRRWPDVAPTLTSLCVGNTSNRDYLMAGFGGNASADTYELGAVSFGPAEGP